MVEEQEARNVSYEFKIGMMDPSREAAIQEKAKISRRLNIVTRNKTKAAFVHAAWSIIWKQVSEGLYINEIMNNFQMTQAILAQSKP